MSRAGEAGLAIMGASVASEPDQEFYDAKVKVLSEDIKHHVKEEEQLMQRRRELTEKFDSEGLPVPETRSFVGHDVKIAAPVQAEG
jgi:hypothetical protein